ncbi:MAG TPA: flagellar motor switch protein FliG, partial [Rugosibacter sp.]|nr:flagellar motor switch protein FliG [Rugosibacter sp.]
MVASVPNSGIEKSAILLLSLGQDDAAEVLKNLGPKDVQKLGQAMAELKQVSRSRIEAVLDEFTEKTAQDITVLIDDESIKTLLNKALGKNRAAGIINRIMTHKDTAGIENLKWMDAATVADLIRNEHAQVIATILAHLDYDQAGEILKQFTDHLRNDVLIRIATLDGIQPSALQELNEAMTRIASDATAPAPRLAMGGI